MDSYKKSRRKSIIAWVIAFVLAIGAAIVSFYTFYIHGAELIQREI